MGSMCMAAAATPPEEEQGKRGREVDEQLADTDQELLRDSLDVRQAVDDWTPSQVAHWLKKEGVTPWHQAQYLASLEDHTIDGHLLLSLHPRDILHALDADMQQERPDDFSRNLDLLHGKVEELRQGAVMLAALADKEAEMLRRRLSQTGHIKDKSCRIGVIRQA